MNPNTQSQAAFLFYPSAYFPLAYSQLGMWIRHKKATELTSTVRVVDSHSAWVHIDCPDRELLLVRNALTVGAPRPLDLGWDEFVPLTLNNTCSQGSSLVERYMINYELHSNKPYASPNTRRKDSFVKDGKVIMCDSGGFQLLTGKAEWVDPAQVGKWYNANVDEGISLDLPIFHITDNDLVVRTAEIQRNNSKVIRDQVDPTFHLFNVVHGHTQEAMDTYRGILESDPDCGDYVCVGGAYNGTISHSIFRLLRFILHPEFKPYKQYHILGVYNTSVLSCIIRMAALLRKHVRPDIQISSDASTAVYSASNRTMHLQRAFTKNAERLSLGRSESVGVKFHEQNAFRTLPCSCNICTSLKYVDIVSHVNDAIVAHAFMFHNMHEIKRWIGMMNHYAETLSHEDYRQLVYMQLSNAPGRNTSLQTLDMIECAITEGIGEASRRFAPLLSSMMSDIDYVGGMGNGFDTDQAEDLMVVPEEVEQTWSEYHFERITTMTERFEQYHVDNKTPDTGHVKKSDMKRTGKKVLMNSTVNKAGKRKMGGKKEHTVTEGQSTHSKPVKQKA